jgi:AraC-like DNA-binding protein
MIINMYEAFKSFPMLSRQLHCKDLLFTHYDCPQTDRFARFYLQYNMIVYVVSGRRIFHKDKKTWEMTEGVCAFVKKGTHISEREHEEAWCAMAFFIPDYFLKQLIDENKNSLPLSNLGESSIDHVLPLNVSEISKSFFYSMMPYFNQVPPPPENLIELKFKELVLSLLTNENKRLLSYLNSLYNEKHPSMIDIMQNNFTFNLSLTDYANLACKSVPTFKREFKRIFNDTPAKWVTKKRLLMASELLENTNLSIGEITNQCGFENQAHFSRLFKEKTGKSPLQFRKSQVTSAA